MIWLARAGGLKTLGVLSATGKLPSARSYHSAALIENKLLVFGGLVGSTPSDEVFLLNTSTSRRVVRVSRRATLALTNATRCVVRSNSLEVVVLPSSLGQCSVCALWPFERRRREEHVCVRRYQWHRVLCRLVVLQLAYVSLRPSDGLDRSSSPGRRSSIESGARARALSLSLSLSLLSLAHWCGGDVERNTWESVATGGTPPAARAFHQAITIERTMYVFGGQGADSQLLNDLYALDLGTLLHLCECWGVSTVLTDVRARPRAPLDSFEWSQPAIVTGLPAPRRDFAAAALPGNRLLIHGGLGPAGRLGDAVLFDASTQAPRRS